MANQISESAGSPPLYESILPDANRANNIVQIERMRMLLANIRTVSNDMRTEVETNNLIPTRLFDPLFAKLDSLHEILNPERPNICYVIGPSATGKSTTINRICRREVCHVSNTDQPGTTVFQAVEAPEMNTIFVDTIGYGANVDGDDELQTKMQEQANIGHPPDALVLVITKDLLRRERELANTIKDVKKYLKWLERQRSNVQVPVLCVLGKIDEYFNGELPRTEAALEEVNEYARGALETVSKHLKENYAASRCVPISARNDYGIEDLRNNINAHSPLNAQIIDRNLDYLSRARTSIANKIIAAFCTASAAVSFLPLVDIVLVTFLQEWMYRMLACFSIDPSRTPENFKTVHRAQQVTSIGIRGAALFVGGALQLSAIGYFVGSGICVATASSSTAIMGWACYHYFTNSTVFFSRVSRWNEIEEP